MTRFIDLLPPESVRDEKFMRMALAIEQAIGAYEDDGGIKGEPPMLCAMVIMTPLPWTARTRKGLFRPFMP